MDERDKVTKFTGRLLIGILVISAFCALFLFVVALCVNKWTGTVDWRSNFYLIFLTALYVSASAATGFLIYKQFKAQDEFNKKQDSYQQSQNTPTITTVFQALPERNISPGVSKAVDEITNNTANNLTDSGVIASHPTPKYEDDQLVSKPSGDTTIFSNPNQSEIKCDMDTTGFSGQYSIISGPFRNFYDATPTSILTANNNIKFAQMFINDSINFGYARFGVCVFMYQESAKGLNQKYALYLPTGINAQKGVNFSETIKIYPKYRYPGIYSFPDQFTGKAPACNHLKDWLADKVKPNNDLYHLVLSFIAIYDNDDYYYSANGNIRRTIDSFYYDFSRDTNNFQPLSFIPNALQKKIDKIIECNSDLRKKCEHDVKPSNTNGPH